jgi:hypothetical protein
VASASGPANIRRQPTVDEDAPHQQGAPTVPKKRRAPVDGLFPFCVIATGNFPL